MGAEIIANGIDIFFFLLNVSRHMMQNLSGDIIAFKIMVPSFGGKIIDKPIKLYKCINICRMSKPDPKSVRPNPELIKHGDISRETLENVGQFDGRSNSL